MKIEDRPHMTLPNGDVIYEGEYGVTRAGKKEGPMTVRCDPLGADGPFKFWWNYDADGKVSNLPFMPELDIIAKHRD